MKGNLQTTYKLAEGPPPVDWYAYSAETTSDYRRLIQRKPKEAEVQRFLEHNPALVPGAFGVGADSGHCPHPSALITQPTLAGFTERIPDFMWIATDSARWYPVLIEIEHPAKRIFRSGSTEPMAAFAQARNQLTQWKTWIRNPANQRVFEERYGIPDRMLGRQMAPRFVLIYGTRAEFEGNRERTRHRANLVDSPDEELMSFERLEPNQKCSAMFTVRANGDGRYTAIAVPPTFTMSPIAARELRIIDGVDDAIIQCTRMSQERRDFLIERLSYWQTWASDDDNGVTGPGCE